MYKPLKQEIVSVLVQNQANVLTRVISMFGRRGFNIDSLTVSPTNNPKLSRITIMFSATEQSMQQIITQTEKAGSGGRGHCPQPGKSVCTANSY